MQTPPVQPMVQAGPLVMNANAAYYLLGVPFGLLLSIPAYMWYERRFANKAEQQSEPPEETAREQPATAAAPTAPAATAPDVNPPPKKPRRKSGGNSFLYVMLAFVGADLLAQVAKMAFPAIPADAVTWGVLTGLSAGFFVMALARNKARA